MKETPPKKVALAQSNIIPGGGTEAVTAWMIESLKNDYDVTLITFSHVEVSDLNRYYGTSLDSTEFSVIKAPLPPLFMTTRRLSILKDHLLMRYCKSKQDDFDLFISPGGVMDFNRRSIQYVGLGPDATLVKVMDESIGSKMGYIRLKRWFMAACERVSGYSADTTRNNITIAPSRWAGDVIGRVFGIPNYKIIYPPVGNSPKALVSTIDWRKRINGFLCIARLVPEKKIENVIETLKLVRETKPGISLHIVGRQDDPAYSQIIGRLCNENEDWITLDDVLGHQELLRLMSQYKYGIHGALDEPFGIALAEMVKLGCIVFVPNGGGQVEIVKSPQLMFNDAFDGAEKILNVLENAKLQAELRQHLNNRTQLFSVEAFCNSTKEIVAEILDQ